MATPMHTIANDVNSDNNIVTPEQDLNNGSTNSNTKAIITPKKNNHLSKKLLLDFMYPKLTHYPTDLFWTAPSVPTAPIVPPRPVKLAATVNNNIAPVLPPRPTNATTSHTNNDATTQLPPPQLNDPPTPVIPARPLQNQFINKIINNIIAKSIADATSTTIILEQTRGTIAKTQYYKNPNIRDDSNNVVKPNVS